MSAAVVVVGPGVVCGPGPVDHELAEVAFECIDDGLALLGDRVVPAADVWRDLLAAAMGSPCDHAVLVHPSWWARSRVERAGVAARQCCGNVVMRERVDVLPAAPVVIELAAELVVVHTGARRHAIARPSPPEDVLEAIAAHVAGSIAVSIDAPTGETRFGADLARTLRSRSIAVTVVGDDVLVGAAPVKHTGSRTGERAVRRRGVPVRAAALLAAAVAATTLAAAGMAVDAGHAHDGDDVTWLVEGRVAVEVPGGWTVERITSGPGSARVQVVSPSNPRDAIAVVQSAVPESHTLDETAAVLREALAKEPDGAFTDLAAGEVGHLTYRETRGDRRIWWTVLLDRGVRIAIGCQGSVDERGPEPQCARAIGSVHAVG